MRQVYPKRRFNAIRRLLAVRIHRDTSIETIARKANTSTHHVEQIAEDLHERKPPFIPIDAPRLPRGTRKSAGGKKGNAIGALGETIIGALLPKAVHVNQQGVDFIIPFKDPDPEIALEKGIKIEVKTVPYPDNDAVLTLTHSNGQWTNTHCDKLIILTRDSLIFADRRDVNKFLRKYWQYHTKATGDRVLIRPRELARLHYANAIPLDFLLKNNATATERFRPLIKKH
jgi:hypothetical protein